MRKSSRPAEVIEARYDQINAFEKLLAENGTTILKFMLHISKEEQRKRLQKRLDEPESRWKFQPGDLEDRQLWDDYQQAYEVMLERCSTPWAPWHVIPADRNGRATGRSPRLCAQRSKRWIRSTRSRRGTHRISQSSETAQSSRRGGVVPASRGRGR